MTHAAIAAAARVSRTTLYKYWPTRGELLFDILNQIEPHKSAAPSGDLRSDLLRMADEMSTAFADPRMNKIFSTLIARAQSDDETSRAQAFLIDAAMTDFRTILEAGVANGEIPARHDVLSLAGRLIGPMFFAALIARTPMTPDEVETLVDEWLDAVRP